MPSRKKTHLSQYTKNAMRLRKLRSKESQEKWRERLNKARQYARERRKSKLRSTDPLGEDHPSASQTSTSLLKVKQNGEEVSADQESNALSQETEFSPKCEISIKEEIRSCSASPSLIC